MNDLLPPPILVVDGAKGRRYRLPLQSIPEPRRGQGLRCLRWAFGGLVVAAFGWSTLAWINPPNAVAFSWHFVVGAAGTLVAITWRELQVHTADGERVGFLMAREPAELDWVATVIRRVMDVPAVERD